MRSIKNILKTVDDKVLYTSDSEELPKMKVELDRSIKQWEKINLVKTSTIQ